MGYDAGFRDFRSESISVAGTGNNALRRVWIVSAQFGFVVTVARADFGRT